MRQGIVAFKPLHTAQCWNSPVFSPVDTLQYGQKTSQFHLCALLQQKGLKHSKQLAVLLESCNLFKKIAIANGKKTHIKTSFNVVFVLLILFDVSRSM